MDQPSPQTLPATQAEPQPPVLDAHGFDPGAYEWIPVARQPRADGWTHALQRDFIEALADTGSVAEAARAVHKSATSCYRLRRAPGAEGFAAAWEAALAESSKRLVDIAFDRAINGTEEDVLDAAGNCIHVRRRTNDRLLMFLLRAHHPARYRPDAVPLIAGPQPLAAAIIALSPATPAEPHRLMDPENFADLVYNDAVLRDDVDASLATLSSLSGFEP